MKHLTTITLTVSGLLIILFLSWRGMLPPAPEHTEQIESRLIQAKGNS